MLILKGSLFGLAIFVVGTIAYVVLTLQRESNAGATSLNLIRYLTIYNPYFWAAFVACLVIGCAMVAAWPART